MARSCEEFVNNVLWRPRSEGLVFHVPSCMGGVFTESSPIAAGAKPYDAEPMKACAYCGASLADDQRYCLECGGRQVQARSQFLSRFTPATVSGPAPSGGGGAAAGGGAAGGGRFSGATAVAGVGVLLLAMGVGVLIGRAGAGKTTTTPAQVISVATPGAAVPGTSNGTAPAVTTPAESSSSATGTKNGGGSGSTTSGGGKGSSSTSKSSSTTKSSSGSSSSGGSSNNGGGSSKTKSSNSGESAEQKTRNIPNVVTTG